MEYVVTIYGKTEQEFVADHYKLMINKQLCDRSFDNIVH